MTRKSSWQKKIALALVFSMTAGSAVTVVPSAYAEETVAPVKATPYVDVVAGHWAEKHIAKLSLQGIVQGYGADGRYGTNDGVSHEDAVIMAVRFLGREDEIDLEQNVVFPEDFGVKDYAKPYVIYAMQNGLLDRDQEFELAEELPEGWGSRKASREWVTRLMIRTIAETELAEELANRPSSFNDRNQIDAEYRGFVNAAVELKLMNGVSEDKFEPKTTVTRAMLATLLSRAQGQFAVDYPAQAQGLISRLTDTAITLFDVETQTSRTFELDERSIFYRFDSETQSAADKLTLYAEALVLAEGGKARFIEGASDDAQVETLEGEIARVVPAENKVWLWMGTNPIEVNYDSSLIIRSRSGQSLTIADLVAGSTVEVQQDTFRSQPLALSLTVQDAPVNKSGAGTVQAVSSSSITVLNSETGESENWEFSSNVLVTLNNQVKQLSDVTAGSSITYEVSNSQITAIRMSQTAGYTETGEFYNVSEDGRMINYISGGEPKAHFLASNVQVVIEGLNNPTTSDLVQGDQLELTVNEQRMITAIKVANRQVEYLNGAQIISYDKERKVLTVLDGRGRAEAITITPRTRITYNGTVYPQQAAEDLLTRDKKISIGYTDRTAVSIELVLNYTGRLTALNQSANTITLALQNGTSITVDYQHMAVDLYGRTTATIADLKIGDNVTAILGANQDRVVALQVHTVAQQEIVSVDNNGKKVRLRADDGTVTDWFVTSNWQFHSAANQPITLANLTPGQLVNVTFIGKQPAALKVVDVKSGKLASIGSDRITITEYNGSSTDVQLGSSFRIEKNGAVSTSTAALAVGDHVEIRKDTLDQPVVAVNSGVTRTFWRQDTAAGELHVLRNGVNDNNYRFKLSPETKVYVDGALSSVDALKNGDRLTLYVVGGKLVEVIK
ncbi:S-layer homology domain-containing protein [Paenibacillus sp. 1P07SE]|uniref:S-layer homology domain-containing protein n=1 Tax=Paenibacillus sp. 1P07SE TaxID=3132209 RepID=UPI0039A4731B